MNICSEVHKPSFKMVYNRTNGSDYRPEWLVCDFCHEKRYFVTPEDMVSIEKLNSKFYFRCSHSIDLELYCGMRP